MASDVLVLGGGFSGLSCAAALAEKGARVRLVEKKPHLGGRAYSFRDPESGEAVDNGQHLFMGCYRQTRAFLKRIGAAARLEFFRDIRVDFADAQGRRAVLNCPPVLGAPLHLAWGVLGLGGLSAFDKLGLLRLDRALRPMREVPESLDRMTVREWLDSLGQSRRVQERLFDPIALGTLNEHPAVAAATGFAQVLREIFYRDAESTRLGLSSVGLSELYTEQARRYIEGRGGEVVLSRKISSLIEEGGRVAGAVAESGERLKADFVVSTLPPWDLAKLGLSGPWRALRAAPIVSLCLWLDEPLLKGEPLVGLLGTRVQWVFDKGRILRSRRSGQYLSLVMSGAHERVGADPKALVSEAAEELARCFPGFQKDRIRAWKVVKEPFATLSPVPGSDALRPEPGTGTPGFLYAGDWTRTGLPATIESAVASGHRAAETILTAPGVAGAGVPLPLKE